MNSQHNLRDLSPTAYLATIRNVPSCFPMAGLTVAAIQSHIFKAQDRIDSKGRRIPGNGLAETGAIIRRGRRILIDVAKYGKWLAAGDIQSTTSFHTDSCLTTARSNDSQYHRAEG